MSTEAQSGDASERVSSGQRLQAVAVRELITVVRTRSYLALLVLIALVVFTIARAGGGPQSGYLPTVTDIRAPVEVLVPVVAVTVGYRTIVADDERGELDVLKTYPLPAWAYVLGVYVGRALAVTVLVGLPLLAVGLYVAVTAAPQTDVIATHAGADSFVLFARFLGLTVAFGWVVVAMSLAGSAIAWSLRSAMVIGVVILGAVVVGFDLLLVQGVGSGVIDGNLVAALAASPTSAYRGMVFESVLSAALTSETQHVSLIAGATGLLGWTVLSLVGATVAVRRR
jgi:ABC-2 type transport system permease protein